MARAVTLCSGQWADLKLATLLPMAKKFGYDGIELACWGDFFEVQKVLSSGTYCKQKWDLLAKNKELGETLAVVHQSLNYTLAALVLAHVGAALKHHLIDRDDVLRRMLPFLKQRN